MSGSLNRALGFIVGVTMLSLLLSPQPVAPAWREPGWNLVFGDEFEGGGLDGARWVTCYWWAIDGCAIGTNGELEWYQPANVRVTDGALHLEARREQVTTPDGELRAFTSGMVSSGRATSNQEEAPRFAFTYGRAEIRAQIPVGQGLWPAFWLLPLDHESRPEIDVMEILGHDTGTLRMHYHYTEDGERASLGRNLSAGDLAVGWHTYTIEWAPQALVWYLDGHEVWRVEDRGLIPDEPMYLIVNLAVGGEFPGDPDESTPFPTQYEVDYVRVWQRDSS